MTGRETTWNKAGAASGAEHRVHDRPVLDLSTNYLGLRLKNPLVAGASPLSRDVDTVRTLEEAGVAAVIVHSLFQEQIEHEAEKYLHFQEFGTQSHAEALTYAPRAENLRPNPHDYADHIAHLKRAVGIPVIASLNAATLGDWTNYARSLEQAGADALELNIYSIATDPTQSAEEVENRYLEILAAVKESASLPVALKLGPYFSSLAHFAKRLDARGVDGLVLFNRFYQPDIDLERLEVVPDLVLSAAHEMRVPLRWIAILDPLIEASLAATTGVYTAEDVLKLLMVGADVTMLCAALIQHGVHSVSGILQGMANWMEEHEYLSVHQLQGSMNQRCCGNPALFERTNYMHALQSFL